MQALTKFNKLINRAITRTMDRLNDTIIKNTTESIMGIPIEHALSHPLLCAEEMDFLSINEWMESREDRAQ